MTYSVGDIGLGTMVYSSDGEQLGKVAEIANNPNPEPGGSPHLYMQVDGGMWFEFWVENLYIPFADISHLDPDLKVTVNCTKAEAMERYAKKPGFLS